METAFCALQTYFYCITNTKFYIEIYICRVIRMKKKKKLKVQFKIYVAK